MIWMDNRLWSWVIACAVALIVSVAVRAEPPSVRHVFVIVLENESYATVFSPHTAAPYLGRELPHQGALLTRYYGIGHYSLDNYLAMISGQPPNPDTQYDCQIFNEFVLQQQTLDEQGVAIGHGCVYPSMVKTLPDQLEAMGFTWQGYMEDMGNNPRREASSCAHSAIGAQETLLVATVGDQYSVKHNPFVYFHSIIDEPKRCDTHIVPLTQLSADLASADSTPNFVYVTPNLCHDGHDAPCVDGQPGGLVSADQFLRQWVPVILRSPAYQKDGLLIVTFDEGADPTACCGERGMPGSTVQPGFTGPGGGQIATVLISPFIKPGTRSAQEYNHYSLLRSMEDIFGLEHLALANESGLASFGADVFGAHPGRKAHAIQK
jgi:phosphatidylinositol-3-phosphatase